ncbi:MAG TPA: SDR family NAD(P)-dependent oxidoreductase [Tepidisphaeraceae bacterium]|nr:SDR family NAD(P)-dependent oxidoreductase [Tepidisphaeraceae bacterium]
MAGNWVLITGASTGIGRACAAYLARRNWRVIAAMRNVADGQALREEGVGSIELVQLDVTDAAGIAGMAGRVAEITGESGLRGLVNNAGISVVGPVEFVPLEQWRRQFEVNFFGQIAVTQAMLPLMRKQIQSGGFGSGRIVMMSSISGRVAAPIMGPYAASKFAMEAMSDALRLEVMAQGIRVCLIEPGAIDTPIWKKGETEASSLFAADSPAIELYGKTLKAIEDGARKSAAGAIPADRVAEVVEKCLTRRRPRTRYLIGRDAKIGGFAKAVLPDRVLDYGMARAFGIPRR